MRPARANELAIWFRDNQSPRNRAIHLPATSDQKMISGVRSRPAHVLSDCIQYLRFGRELTQSVMSEAFHRMRPAPKSIGKGKLPACTRRQIVVRLRMPVIFITSWQVSSSGTDIVTS